MIDLSVVIVTWNTRDCTLSCLSDLVSALAIVERRRNWTSEVMVVDNASTDGTSSEVRRLFPDVSLRVNSENLGFARGVNEGLKAISGRYVLLLNSDAFIGAATIEVCLDALESNSRAGIAGPRLLHGNGKPQRSVHTFPDLWSELVPPFVRGRVPRVQDQSSVSVEAVRGAVLFARMEMIKEIGLLSEDYFFFLEETDWCWRAQKSHWEVLFVSDAWAIHLMGESSKRRNALRTRIEFQRSLDLFLRKHRGPKVAQIVLFLRIMRGLVSGLIELPLAIFRPRVRDRLGQRLGLLRWQMGGRSSSEGLEGWKGRLSD